MELALSLCDEIVLLHQGTLKEIDRSHMSDQELRDKILEALTE